MSVTNTSGFIGSTSRFDSYHNQNSNGSFRYPSPFFDIGHTYLPTSVKQMFRWCRYYFMVNPLINAVTYKMAEYPITKLVVNEPDSDLRKKWESIIENQLKLRTFQIETGLDYFCYGNAFVTMHFPFDKYLICRGCHHHEKASSAVYKFRNFKYFMACNKCSVTTEALVYDHNVRNLRGIKLIRWNPEHITVEHNDVTGKTDYFFDVPVGMKNDIMMGKRHVIENTPNEFIEALKSSKTLRFNENEVYHLKRPTIAQKDQGWGLPLILPVLKDTHYLQILRKAQESIAQQYIVPLRVLFPAAGSNSSDPYCISPQTLVETLRGLQPAEEINTGDYLRSHTGAWRRVEAAVRRNVSQEEKTYRLKVASLAAFQSEFAEDHPILAVPRATKGQRQNGLVDPDFIPIKDLKIGDFVAYPIRRVIQSRSMLDLNDYLIKRTTTDEYIYRTIGQKVAEIYEWLEENNPPDMRSERNWLEEKGWQKKDFVAAKAARKWDKIDRIPRYLPVTDALADLVGYYIAEGFTESSGLASFGLHINELWIEEEIEQAVQSLGFRGVSHYVYPDTNSRTVKIQDILLSELLVGLCGKGFAQKRIPQVLAESPNRVVLRMLRALFAGDGCSFKTETNRVGLKLSNPHLIIETRRLLLSFGLIGGTTKEVFGPGDISKADAYQLNYNNTQAEALRLLFSDGQIPIGEEPYTRSGFFRGDYVLLPIRKIQKIDLPEVIGFQMAVDQSFCVAGIATHNSTADLSIWRTRIEREIEKWKLDQNYIPILPLPIGNETIGGEGKALMLHQEMRAWSEQIVAGMHVPIEFVFGGLQYSGSNVSMRMLENQFLGYRTEQLIMCRDFILARVARYMGWSAPNVSFRRFRMADDLQRIALAFQLNQAQKVSDTTLLDEMDYDIVHEEEHKEHELAKQLENQRRSQIAAASLQGDMSIIQARYQNQAMSIMGQSGALPTKPPDPAGMGSSAGGGTMDTNPPAPTAGPTLPGQAAPPGGQQLPPPPKPPQGGDQPSMPGMPAGATVYNENAQSAPQQGVPIEVQSPLNMQQAGGGQNILYLAQRATSALKQMQPQEQQMQLMQMRAQQPQLYSVVLRMLMAGEGSQTDNLNPLQSPLPQVKPPRRDVPLV